MTVPVFHNHFQHAYIVRDLEKAMARFKDLYGVANWHVMPMPPGEGSPTSGIALAYVDAEKVMIELIEGVPEVESLYQDWIPESESGARFHHLGFLIDDEDEYRNVVGQFEAAGFPTAFAGSSGDILDFHYADTVAELGHYCELVHLRPAGKDFFAPVPHN